MAAHLNRPIFYAQRTYDLEHQENSKDFKKTLAAIDRLLKYPPENDDAPALNLKVLVLKAQNKPNEAIESYQKAIERDSNLAEAYMNWGDAETKRGNLEIAEQKYREWIAVRFKNAVNDQQRRDAFQDLGFRLAKLERDNETIDAYRRV